MIQVTYEEIIQKVGQLDEHLLGRAIAEVRADKAEALIAQMQEELGEPALPSEEPDTEE